MSSILIKNGYVVTVDKNRRVIKNGSIVIEDDKIVEVDKSDQIEPKKYNIDQVIDAKGHAVLPGLISTHTHTFQTFLRSLGDDMNLIDWVRTTTQPHYPLFKERDMFLASAVSYLESIRTGTTTQCDMQYVQGTPTMSEEPLKSALDIGFRAVVCRAVSDEDRLNIMRPEALALWEDLDDSLRRSRDLHSKWHGKKGLLYVWAGPNWPPGTSDRSMQEFTELAQEWGTKFPFHLAETKWELDNWLKLHKKTPTKWLYELNPQMGKVVLAVHAVYVNSEDIAILARTGTPVSHNTTSNCYLASGIAPIPEMLKTGVTVSLGVDGAASNNTQDLWEMMKLTALIHKVNTLDATSIRAEDVIEMATINGAKALGLEHEIGSIEPGKKADVILVDLTGVNYTPLNRVISQLIYCGNSRDVATVLINGKVVMEDKKILTVDEDQIKLDSNKAIRRIMMEAGTDLDRQPEWKNNANQ